jgi:hypothetical protein
MRKRPLKSLLILFILAVSPSAFRAAGHVKTNFAGRAILGIVRAHLPASPNRQADKSGENGIPFGFWNLPMNAIRTPLYNGSVIEESNPTNIIPDLEAARSAEVRVFIRFVGGRHNYQDPATGCFSATLWEQRLARHAQLNLKPFVDDGTLMGNMMLDDVTNRDYWCGAPIPYSDVEAVARYSKRLFPYLPTAVRADMKYLEGYKNWVYLDMGWATYRANKGDVQKYVDFHTSTARALGLGLVTGLNLTDGGDGKSGIPSYWNPAHGSAMSAEEITRYGRTILDNPYVCGFFMWDWVPEYLARPDIASALKGLQQEAAKHPRTACVVRNPR